MFNRNYIDGRMTKTMIWSLITSYYDSLPVPDSGPMKANTPWSGHYEVQPALWAIAHTTQFAQPGWKYLDTPAGCSKTAAATSACEAPTAGGDYSIIIETVDAKTPQTLSFRVTGGLATGPLHVWRSNQQSQFDRQDDISPADGSFTVVLGARLHLLADDDHRAAQRDRPRFRRRPISRCRTADDFES